MVSNDTNGGGTRRRFLRQTAATGALAATGLAGCTDGGGGVSDLKVGYVSSLSGPFAVFGQAGLNGARLALQDLEDELGVSIEVVTGDSEVNPQTGLERMRELVTREEIDFAMGGVSSAVAARMGTWASDNGVVYFPTGAHSDTLTGEGCAKYTFRPTCSNSMLAKTVGTEMVDAGDSWHVLYSDYIWGQTAQAAVSRILEENGKEVVGTSAVPFPSDDYTQYVNEANNSDADGIALLIAGLDLRKAINVVTNRGIQDDYTFAMHQLEDVVLWGLGKDNAGILDIAGQVWGPAAPGGGEFEQRVADNYDTDPYVRHYLGYVSMDQAVRAADRAGSTDPDEMSDALEGHQVEDSPIVEMKGGGEMYWRECDHQLVQPAFGVGARSIDDMEDSQYKNWFEVEATYAGDDVARSCDETGCSL
jgi:ABC-type branched-subunit amino acid transport system substrate-binding protein